MRFDRFSDSAGTYVTLDSNNPAIYKQLYRAAKAKLKLRLKATITKPVKMEKTEEKAIENSETTPKNVFDTLPINNSTKPMHSFLDTVLSQPLSNGAPPSFKSFQQTCSYSPRCAIPGAFHPSASTEVPAKVPQTPTSDLFSLPTLPSLNDFPLTTYSIDCNHCGKSVPNEHYHCSICENGDFDLCKACVDNGVYCDGDEHWLIKRTIKSGVVVPSVTETLPPKKLAKAATSPVEEVSTPTNQENDEDERTCNCCISRKFQTVVPMSASNDRAELSAREFVTCNDCPDFDLCLNCFADGEHGHDPSHAFHETIEHSVDVKIKALCAPGRGVHHAAICDGCDKASTQTRLKYLLTNNTTRLLLGCVTSA